MNRTLRRHPAAFRRLTLWPRLAVVVTLGFVVLFAGFSALGIRAVDTSTNRILHERLAITEELADDFDGLLQHRFAALAAFDARVSPPGVERRLLEEIYRGGGGTFTTLALLDRRGRVVVSLGKDAPAAGARLAGRRDVARVLATGRRTISAPFRDPRGEPVVALDVPVGGRRAPRASLVATIDLQGADVMERLDAARRLGRTGHAELVGPGGIALASTEPGGALRPGEHLAFYRKMLRARAPGIADVPVTPGHREPTRLGRERHVMAFVRLTDAWGVALGGTDSDTYAPARHLRRTLMLAGGGSLGALWLLTLLGARLLVRPVRGLTRAAERMASGDLERRISVSEGGEIGVLGESLETMRVQLRDSLETVRRWGEELELKVGERTAELNARNRQLAAVGAIMTAANETHDLEGMLSRCLDLVLEQTGMDAGAVRLLDRGRAQPTETVVRGAWSDVPCRSCADRFCLAVAAEGQPLRVDGRERLHPGCAVVADALAILPLRGPSGIVGVLTLARLHGDPLPPEEEPVLAAICDQIGVAIENAHLAAELRRLEAQHEVQRMRSELISAVSHELRTPLGFIKSYATTLLREDAPIDAATRRQFLRTIDEETDKLEHMIDELLDASRLQAGRLAIECEPVRLGALLRGIVEKARMTLAEGRDVRLELPAADPLVLVDAVRIEQVLDNLLENAARYSSPGSPIVVRLAADMQDAHVSVADRGDGIPESEIEHVFEPFYRGQSSKRRRVGGAGLGLAICRGIVEAHGGRIRVESVPGGGTTFLFSVPLAAPASRGGS